MWNTAPSTKKEIVDGSDFHLAGRKVSGWVGGISAATSSHSAFMLTGMVGAILYDFAYVWLLIGWFIGVSIVWLFYYPKVWELGRSSNSITLTNVIEVGIHEKNGKTLKIFVGGALAILLGFYASAQIIAADATLDVAFGENSFLLVMLGFVIVLLYSAFGGMRSTINSDIAQGLTVLISIILVVGFLITYGIQNQIFQDTNTAELLSSLSLVWGDSLYITILFIAGWIVGGMAEIGAPHVIPRLLSIKSKNQLRSAAFSYLLWFGFLSLMVIILSLLIKITSTHLITVSETTSTIIVYGSVIVEILPSWLAGIALAGFVAATISTADSLILAAGAAITEDTRKINNVHISNTYRKIVTGLVGLLSFVFYYFSQQSLAETGIDLYEYITLAWALISCVFVPSIVMQLLGRSYTIFGVIVSSTVGMLVIKLWTDADLQNSITYELLPALLAAIVTLFFFSKVKVS